MRETLRCCSPQAAARYRLSELGLIINCDRTKRVWAGEKKETKMKILRVAATTATFLMSTVVSAEQALENSVAALLGQERAIFAAMSAEDLSALTGQAGQSNADAELQTVTYSKAFLADMPSVQGGAQWRCFAEALYFEARGETTEGLFAVGEVILNRVDSARYPDTLCSVINQGTGRKYACQFTYTCDGLPENINEPRAWERVGKVAHILMEGAPRNLTNGATHYHTTAVNPSWARRFPRTAQYGVHIFYRQPT